MEISTLQEGKLSILSVNGDLDASSSILLDQAIEQTIAKGIKKLLIDCTKLNYISSAGLGVFMSHLQEFESNQTSLVLFGLNEKVFNVFQVACNQVVHGHYLHAFFDEAVAEVRA